MTTETHTRNIAVQEQLKNEAIDNAFREIHEDVQLIFATLDAHNKTLANILEILHTQGQQLETLEKHVEFLEKRTHHLAPKIEDV